ncbi:MAG: ATP-dependent zinc metalloprotease FtsH [Chlorobium sp.]|jgi:cell division protease FtsH|uniref:ATP-dependent zinc metalloprotease FtsH n=1 Tax=Chlorobium sp. TaxID=1095 RepID=UPI001D2E6A23|nr:ATP-dependent zinc metalloprotease FtsH [Chlorobium sp.]MBN1279610.1 ATP-dependent zinc metalloprotease FtsH [Chlorobiaceae bacterium]MCF8215379.1 ATP-dependent zinc metalloprotease FtsH [Chlorobium sp.]MCF8270217.1 ATP-dependent zinc metalloprotease FtsH [Chlorobium sp.]MCF8286586.1 ATP-dependent zinc metalloprotease FtsH [Chlorobium sp.]MCF8290185.1 ATP-dependent zinc metalloprotease FtsH [Chlorobium sp.]
MPEPNKKNAAKGKDNFRNVFKPVRDEESGQGRDPQPGTGTPGRFPGFLVIMMLGLLSIFVFQRFFSSAQNPEVTYNQYRTVLEKGLVTDITVKTFADRSAVLEGKLKTPSQLELKNNTFLQTDRFSVTIPTFTIEQADLLAGKGIQVTVEEGSSGFDTFLILFAPWIIFGLIYFFMFRRMAQQNGGAAKNMFSFGKSRAKMISEFDVKVSFKDVAGVDEAVEELKETVEFLTNPERFQKIGGKIPKGVLLLGPPGTGKTLLAKAIAGEAKVPFFSISGADFVEMFVGVGAARVRDLFEQAKKNSPCIVFIDEIDAVGRSRGAGLGGGHDEREQTLNQLLVEMDGFATTDNVILIAATNRPDVLDSALLRPGRFDRQITIDKPDIRGREAILAIHTRKTPLADDVNISVLAKSTPGFSGADLANIVNEAALIASRSDKESIDAADFEQARDKVLMGPERKSMFLSDEQKKLTAYHEAGHVLVAANTKGSDPIHKVTIIPRGRSLGLTAYLPIEDRYTQNRQYLLAIITYALGGRVAEELVFNEITTGAANDIERATDLARRMVRQWGMSDKLGPINYGDSHKEVFLGKDYSHIREYSEETAMQIDNEVRKIIIECMDNARTILSEKKELLHKLAVSLIEKETLNASEIEAIIGTA